MGIEPEGGDKMEKYCLKATVSDDRSIVVGSLPFDPGDLVEISIRAYDKTKHHFSRYPLRGKPFQYIDPFESVAEDDWEVLKLK